MKALKWLVLCLALSMAACQPADEESADEDCLVGIERERSCDELYQAALREWEYCLTQGAENDIMLDALEVIHSVCIFDVDCTDPFMMDTCLNDGGFTCSVSMGDMGLSYACQDVLGLHQ